MEPSKVIGVLKPFRNHFIPYRVSLVGYIRPRQTFSSDSKDLVASLGLTYLNSRIYPASIRF
jgi:hypothetical protein